MSQTKNQKLHVLVYGGSGALGKSLIKNLKEKNYVTINVDFNANDDTTNNLILKFDTSFQDNYKIVSNYVKDII